MKRVKLGGSDLEVSEICLGTMTFGNQTPEAEGHAQIDRAVEIGMTFLDTAEMYPVNPVRAETVGRTETIIGNWLAARGGRDRVEIATKVTGPSGFLRGGRGFDAEVVRDCVDASLKRLQTDYIDLYQLHWPVRGSYAFRQNWGYDPSAQDRAATIAHMEDVLGALEAARQAGKIRAIGLSNESAWGLTRWLDVAGRVGAPRIASIQNEYSLLYRMFDTDLAEAAVNEDVTLLAYSPLAAGLLSGKYLDKAVPGDSRMAVDIATGGAGNLGGRKTARAEMAVAAYQQIATEHGWDLVQMAIAWQLTRPFKNVPIIGATTLAQLDHMIEGFGRVLPKDVIRAVDRAHRDHAMPY